MTSASEKKELVAFVNNTPNTIAAGSIILPLLITVEAPKPMIINTSNIKNDDNNNNKERLVVIMHAKDCSYAALHASRDAYNAIVLSHRLVALRPIKKGEAITVHSAQYMYSHTSNKENTNNNNSNHNNNSLYFEGLSAAEKQALYPFADDSVRAAAIRAGFLPDATAMSEHIDVVPYESGRTVVSKINLAEGQVLFRTTGIIIPFPLVNTVALPDGTHLRLAGGAEFLDHSCDPTLQISFHGDEIVATTIRAVKAGERVTYNYLTTEWNMSIPFTCRCGCDSNKNNTTTAEGTERKCFGTIRGFKYLDIETQRRLAPMASQAVLHLWSEAMPHRAELATVEKKTLVHISEEGHAVAKEPVSAGQILLNFTCQTVKQNTVKLDSIIVRHSSTPTAAVVENRLVALKDLTAGCELTVHVALLAYTLPPFKDEATGATITGFSGLSEDERDRWMLLVEPGVRAEAVQKGATMRSSSPLVSVRANGDMGQTTFAAADIASGTRFFHTTGLVLPFPTVYTILLGDGKHLLFAGGAQCLAHSCDPNVRIDVNPAEECIDVVALRDIKAGEVIAFNYLTTEFDMNTPFPCLCGAKQCFRMIRGYKHLTTEQKRSLRGLTTPAVEQLLRTGTLALPPFLTRDGAHIATRAAVERSTVLFECTQYEVHERHIELFGAVIAHCGENANTVLVEGYLVALRPLADHEVLTVNMCYFVYDMVSLFPETHDAACRGFKYLPEEEKQRKLYLCEPPVRAAAMRDGWIVKSTNAAIVVRPNGDMGQTAYAATDIAAGTRLFHATGLLVPFPTMYTICVGERKHLLFGDAAETLPHHCDPNVRVTVRPDATFDMITVRPVASGEMLSFNYTTTEWDMNSSFPCLCGSPLCAHMIRGFKYLGDADRQRLWPLASDYIKSLVEASSRYKTEGE